MDILTFHKSLIEQYRSYIQSFVNIKDPDILRFVEEEFQNKKLWPEPLVQFNPTFERGGPLKELVDQGLLHPELNKIFYGFNLYRHQEEAIRLGAAGREFIVTSGTGSGKSLTFMATIFNSILKSNSPRNVIQAVIVYPMNALINSQFNEIKKFQDAYIERYNVPFPITFGQYTGQEDEAKREILRANPPHILLTNYMMLELIMTRSGQDVEIRRNISENIQFLVFDELHTYRGRQGSDVSLLIRRIKSSAQHLVTCIGTSATMISSDDTTLLEQRAKVAEVASTVFGSTFGPDQIISEYLMRSLESSGPINITTLQQAVNKAVDIHSSAEIFENNPVAQWLEENIALEMRENILSRRKPSTLVSMAEQLAHATGLQESICLTHLQKILEWANFLNTRPDKKKNYLPYRIHQFIAQTGSVYATLGDQDNREFRLEAGLYAGSGEQFIFPLVFSRESGHEFYCVKLDGNSARILPREFNEAIDEDDEEDDWHDGYIIIQHSQDTELIWVAERDIPDLPDAWFNPPRKDGTRSLKRDIQEQLPRIIHFDELGNFSFTIEMTYKGWFLSRPLKVDPTSGMIFTDRFEWRKLSKLGGEGRSTATTVLSFETILQLKAFGERPNEQKLLSFTDNRQDASLQSGHFNDFISVGRLRAAIAKALREAGSLDYSTIPDHVFRCLNISPDQFAKNPSTFPGPMRDNEDTFKSLIIYRLLSDLRRGWRVVVPNLEQCGLLKIEYRHLDESVLQDNLWEPIELLHRMTAAQRKEFLFQIFDFFRKSYAISFSLLEPSSIEQNTRRIREKLKYPWTLDDNDRIEIPAQLRLERLSNVTANMFSDSAGYSSTLGRYIRKVIHDHNMQDEIQGREGYMQFAYSLFDFLADQGGWLVSRPARVEGGGEVNTYRLRVDQILWQPGRGENEDIDLVRRRTYNNISMPRTNVYFKNFYLTEFHQIPRLEGREHTGQINNEKRKEREVKFGLGEINALFCSPTMELGIDISDLSIVHMRNVPPTPSNYAQRSGRAGRSGQAALVMVYCSNFNAHDRHYFNDPTEMVAGKVHAPRLDLLNEELLITHLHASILTRKSIHGLSGSLSDLVDITHVDQLEIRPEIQIAMQLTDQEKQQILNDFQRVLEDDWFRSEFNRRKPSWFNEAWIQRHIDDFLPAFNRSLHRWRNLYRAAQTQIRQATLIIENRIYNDDHETKKQAYKSLRQAERQRDLLLNDLTEPGSNPGKNKDQSEFYPYRYLASEGFLPGYNFTRLPIRAFMENKEAGGEYISRPRFIALSEFGPKNVIYHDGSKYRLDRIILTEAEVKMERAKISPDSGYIMMKDQFTFNVDPILGTPLSQGIDKYIHPNLVEMPESRAVEVQRITCQEEERTRKGYEVSTYFSVEGGFDNVMEAHVNLDGEKLVHVHAIPAARLVRINFKWRVTREQGFALHLKNGFWQSKKQIEEAGNTDDIQNVKLYATDTSNALYLQPVAALAVQGERNGVITLMYALKRAIENYFQVESNEIGATIMGEGDSPNIMIYEASEGSLGVLNQIVDNPTVFHAVMQEAFNLCFVVDGREIPDEELVPATYDDLLSYYNQYDHLNIDRRLIRESIRLLKDSSVEVLTNKTFSSYDEHYGRLEATRDHNSSTEEAFLKYLYKNGLRLPDIAQPTIPGMYVRPDFLYHPNIFVFCDGTPHDIDQVKDDDLKKREALKSEGKIVLSWYYKDPLDAFVKKYSSIIKQVKSLAT